MKGTDGAGWRQAIALLSVLLAALQIAATAGRAQSPDSMSDASLRHRSAAASYLRTGNPDLAAIEMEALLPAVSGPARRMTEDAIAAADKGDLAAAAAAMARVRAVLAAERRAAGIRLLADCVEEAEEGLAALGDGRGLSSGAGLDTLAERATRAAQVLRGCDEGAPRSIAAMPGWRRLVDGAAASLAQLPAAIARRDADLVHRLIIELRSYERLLAQRFG